MYDKYRMRVTKKKKTECAEKVMTSLSRSGLDKVLTVRNNSEPEKKNIC